VTTDVHQQRMEARPFRRRRCTSCGVRLFDGESARQTKEGFTRVDVCIQCETNGPPRRPQGAPAPGISQ
jgi:RNase P subunit RPR2